MNPKKNTQILNPHIISFITYVSLMPLVYFIPEFVKLYLPNIKWLNVFVVVSIIVPIISYIIIPIAHKAFVSLQKNTRVE